MLHAGNFPAKRHQSTLVMKASNMFNGFPANPIKFAAESSSKRLSPKGISDKINLYFESWNKRDMATAIGLFAEDCIYEDTLYPGEFRGKDSLEKHLLNVANSLPSSFAFKVDSLAVDEKAGKVGVQWHVESNGETLPFTRGTSMYSFNNQGLISQGFDVPEPVVKSGSVSLSILKFAKNIIAEPARLLPLSAWMFYCWFVFLSDLAPGPNALTLDPFTWNEVIKLSLNYLLILPIFSPANAADVHPILEGVFNVMLLWATLFAGFLVDGKETIPQSSKEKQLGLPSTTRNNMLPIVLGMQLLTNAFYLPYLVVRNPSLSVSNSKLNTAERIGESRLLPMLVSALSIVCIIWAAVGRFEEYGVWSERLQSFYELVSRDRLSFSFLVDLVYFSVFQGWLIDDDLKRRVGSNVIGKYQALSGIGRYVPFYGLSTYLYLRPALSDLEPTKDI
jgi:hypothetical protein